MLRRASALIAAALLLMGADEPQLVPDVSQREVQIQYSFTGADLLLFGASDVAQRLTEDTQHSLEEAA